MPDDTQTEPSTPPSPDKAPSETSAARFGRIAGEFTRLVNATPPDAWSRPAPCEGWTARDVVAHLVTWVPAVMARSGIEFPVAVSTTNEQFYTDPGVAWIALADTLQAALEDPAVASRTFDAGPPGQLTVETAINMLVTGDVLVHSWDLAAATGQHADLDRAMAGDMLEGMQHIDELLRGSGHYGPAVEVPDDADVIDRLVAFTGRDPKFAAPIG